MPVSPGLGNSVGQLNLAAGDSAYGITYTPQPTGISIGGCDSCRVERVEPPFGGVGGLLELFTGSGHGHHLYKCS